MSNEEHDEQREQSDEEQPARESDETGFVVDESGDIEVVGPSEQPWRSDEGIGGPEQDFGGIFSGTPFRGRERFQLTRPAFWSRPLRLFMLIAGIFYVGNILPDVLTQGLTLWRLIGLVGLPLLAGLAVAYRSWKLPDEGLEIVFTDKGLRLPKGADNPSYMDVDFHDLRSLVVMARGETELVVMETESTRFAFTSHNFREPNGPRLLKDEIMRRVKNHPDGQTIVDRMQALDQRAREASRNSTPVMYGLLGMVLIGYVIEWMTGALSTQLGLVQLGANSTPLIAEGQWWRLISANFLHGGFLHIFLNGLALFFLGMYIERLIGSWRFLTIYLVSAVGGSVGSYVWTGAPLSVGASTALYGLVGAFGVLHIKYWREIPPPYRQTIQWWVVILGLNVGLSLVVPQIDAAAHFAGMGVGVAVTFIAVADMSNLRPTQDASLWLKIAGAAMTAIFAAGLGMAWNYAQYDHPGDRTSVYAYMVERAQEKESPDELNQTAWFIAVSPEASSEQLALGREAVKSAIAIRVRQLGRGHAEAALAEARSVAREAGDGGDANTPKRTVSRSAVRRALLAYRDTFATIEYRLGMKAGDDEVRRQKFAAAIRIERDVLREKGRLDEREGWVPGVSNGQDQTHRSQLARFLDTYHAEFGRFAHGEPLSEKADLLLEARRESLALRVDIPTRVEARTELIGLAYADGKRTGVFQICLPPDAKGGIVERFGADEWSTGLGPNSNVELALTDTSEPMCEGESTSVEYWPTAPEVRSWP